MVSSNPGPWFDESLAALAAQDYSNLAVLVIDAASDTDPTPRVASVLPEAFVRRLDADPGFGAAANLVTDIVDGAAFYCFLHDDVALMPDAITLLVGEALRSNAGIVGPKLVDWDDPRLLLQVGEGADKTGERVPSVERGELDQEQHDAVRDVFVVPGAATLVRSDLFGAIGGFDAGIDLLNDDLNLCWRAHVAGARVIVAPDAVVRHREALADRSAPERASQPSLRRERLIRHRLRTMLTCYSGWHLLRVVPQAVFVAIVEVVFSILIGRRGQAGDVIRAWRWNLARRTEIRAQRRIVQASRTVPDSEIRRFQLRGSARVMGYFRSQNRGGSRSDQAQASVERLMSGIRDGSLRWPLTAWFVTLSIVALGTRALLTNPIPAVGGFIPFDQSAIDMGRAYLSGWRDVGLGSESPAPSAFGVLGVVGSVLFGAMGTVRRILILGAILSGLIGSYRLLRPTGSVRAQSVSLVLYGAIPLAYDAVAQARLGSLVIYGAMPWILGHVARSSGLAPFAPDPSNGIPPRRRIERIASLGLLLALVVAFEPAVMVVMVLVVIGLTIGSFATTSVTRVPEVASITAAALGVAVILNLPWMFDFALPGSTWAMVVGNDAGVTGASFFDLLRFDVGPVGGSALAIGLPIAALLPLLIGREWRFDWAVRAWCVALVSIFTTWAGAQGWMPIALPTPTIMLAPAAISLAVAAGLGIAAFEIDLRAYGFGWRQLAAAVAGAAILIGALPTLLDAGNGRWYLPTSGLESTFAFMEQEDPGFRVLWVGDPDVLPVAGFRLNDEFAYATTVDGLPTATDAWPGSAHGSTQLIEDVLAVAQVGETSRLGRLLAPMAIRYVVIPLAAAPRPSGGQQAEAPAALVDALAGQLDMTALPVNPAYVVYRNEAALPARAQLGADTEAATIYDLSAADVAGATVVLPDQSGPTTFTGPLTAGATVLHATAAADGWQLTVDGTTMERTKVFGWADGYTITADGDATLRYRTSVLRYGLILIQVVLWAGVITIVVRSRRRHRRPALSTRPPRAEVD